MNKLLILPLVSLFLLGCNVNNNLSPEEKAEKKLKTILTVVENGVTFSVKTYTSTLEGGVKEKVDGYFNDAARVIDGLITDGKIAPDVVDEYLKKHINDNVPSPFDIALTGALDLGLSGYNTFYAKNVKDNIANKEKAVRVLKAVVAGVESGLDPISGDVLDVNNPLEGYTDWEL